jgi:hypothetical protein
MGILTDVVIARPDDAEAISLSDNPGDSWATLEMQGILYADFDALHCAITGTPCNGDLEHILPFVAGDKECGPWVFRFHDDVLNALAAMPAGVTDMVGQAWAASEGLQTGGWSGEEATALVVGLGDLARQAKEHGLAMFVWTSL